MIFLGNEKLETKELPFNWAVDYNDGTSLKEYTDSGEKLDYYAISKDNIARFGLFGQGMKLFYQNDGSFNLNGQHIEIEYHVDGNVYNLTCNFEKKDCITYKQMGLTPRGRGTQNPDLESICFGYKSLITNDNTQFYFKPIVMLPMMYENKVKYEISMTSNKDLKGKLVFKNKAKVVDELDFELRKNYTSTKYWYVK